MIYAYTPIQTSRSIPRATGIPRPGSDEVQAVMDLAEAKRPGAGWLVLAGRVISDYVTTHGAGKLAGINFVDASIKADPTFVGDNPQEPAFDGIGGSRHQHRGDARLRARLLLQTADPRDFEVMLSLNMMVPPKVRAAALAVEYWMRPM